MKNNPTISIIVAMTDHRVIGDKNRLPWHLSDDLKRFKRLTLGKPIIMGRKTYESIGKPLPGRTNIILTRDAHFKAEGCVVETSLAAAIEHARSAEEIMIIGGEQIYRQAFSFANKLYLTVIHYPFSGDAVFPEWNMEDWEEIQREDHDSSEGLAPFSFSYVTLKRR